VHRAIQHRQESITKLAARGDLNPNTIATWQKRAYVPHAPMGWQPPHSTGLTKEQEALIATCRRHTLLALDDGLSAWPSTIPHLTRSLLHRCVKRGAISRLPASQGDKPQQKTFKPYPIGYFHIDRPSKCASAELHPAAIKTVTAQCPRHLMAPGLTHFTPGSPIMASGLPIGS
jgi:hypothetical protein